MTFSVFLNLFVLAANAATVILIFWNTRLMKRAYDAQNNVNRVLHARVTNLERHVLGEQVQIERQPNVH